MNPIRTSTLALFAAILPAASMAQTATAFAERSEVIATGQDIHLYGLSTKDDEGKVHCFDVTASLSIVGSTGKPASTAAVTSAACPKVKPGEFAVGAYTDVSGNFSCTLASSPFAGRTEFDLACSDTAGRHHSYTWYTGPISGSPIEAQLDAAKLDTLPGNDQYAWGRITRSDWNYDGCTYFGSLFGAREVNGRITLSIYGGDAILDCTHEYLKSGQ
jgi:hypothetical protein